MKTKNQPNANGRQLYLTKQRKKTTRIIQIVFFEISTYCNQAVPLIDNWDDQISIRKNTKT